MRRARSRVNEVPTTSFLIFKLTHSKVDSVFLLTNSSSCVTTTMTNTQRSYRNPRHSYPGLALSGSRLLLATQMSAQQHLNTCVCVCMRHTERDRERQRCGSLRKQLSEGLLLPGSVDDTVGGIKKNSLRWVTVTYPGKCHGGLFDKKGRPLAYSAWEAATKREPICSA